MMDLFDTRALCQFQTLVFDSLADMPPTLRPKAVELVRRALESTSPKDTLQVTERLCSGIVHDEALQGLLGSEPEVCLRILGDAIESFTTARGAAAWVAGARFGERLASIVTDAGALEDPDARADATAAFNTLADFAQDLDKNEGDRPQGAMDPGGR